MQQVKETDLLLQRGFVTAADLSNAERSSLNNGKPLEEL